MKVVLTGASGFVGSELLLQLLTHREVTGVTTLTRRSLGVSHPKLVSLLHADFSHYDDALVDRLTEHHACIWALGGKASDFASELDYARVTHDFTIALAERLAARVRPLSFCYLSGMGADPSESAILPWERTTRHLKGRTEQDLVLIAANHPGFTPYSFRPGGILPKHGKLWAERVLRSIAIPVNVLAAAMIEVALRGYGAPTIHHARLRAIAGRKQ